MRTSLDRRAGLLDDISVSQQQKNSLCVAVRYVDVLIGCVPSITLQVFRGSGDTFLNLELGSYTAFATHSLNDLDLLRKRSFCGFRLALSYYDVTVTSLHSHIKK